MVHESESLDENNEVEAVPSGTGTLFDGGPTGVRRFLHNGSIKLDYKKPIRLPKVKTVSCLFMFCFTNMIYLVINYCNYKYSICIALPSNLQPPAIQSKML